METTRRNIEILRSLIRHNTCQPDGNETALVNAIEAMLLPFNPDIEMTKLVHSEHRASLVIKVGKGTGGLALLGHLDTVTIGDKAAWEYDPFAAVVADGYIHGRGSVDMKGGVANLLDIALELLEEKVKLKKPVYFVFTADEEKGTTGITAVRDRNLLNDVDAVLIPEPTTNRIGTAEKGALWFRFVIHGKQAHGSKPEEGINAIDIAIDLAHAVKAAVEADTAAHPLLGRATCSINRLDGGIMTNVIPPLAIVELDCRTLPHQTNEDFMAIAAHRIRELETNFPGLKVDTEIMNNHPAIEADASDPFIQVVKDAVAKAGLNTDLVGMSYYTDAGRLIPEIKKPFVIMGPGHESMAHQVNEKMLIESLHASRDVYRRIVANCCE